MFGTLDLASFLVDSGSIIALFTIPIGIYVSMWGAKRLVGLVKSFF